MAPSRGRAGLGAVSVAVALIIVDSTIVNVAIPNIVTDLTLSSSQVQWVQESYFGGAMILPTTFVAGAIFVWRTVHRTRAGKPTLFKFDLSASPRSATATSPP